MIDKTSLSHHNTKTSLDLGKEGGLSVSFLFYILSVALDNPTVPFFKVRLSFILPNTFIQRLASSWMIIALPWMPDVVSSQDISASRWSSPTE